MSLFDSRYPEASKIVVGTMSEAVGAQSWCEGMITIEDYGYRKPFRLESGANAEQLVLVFNDVECVGDAQLAAASHVEAALSFGRKYEHGNLFIHCHAGQCRSPAIALAIIADRMGPGREDEAVDALKVVRRWSTPNRWVVELADRILQRDGDLVRALKLKGNTLTRLGSVDFLKKNANIKVTERPVSSKIIG